MEKKDHKKDTSSDDSDKSGKKAMFIQRISAFLIDAFIVLLVTSLIASPFINVKKINSLNEKSADIISKYQKKEISTKEYVAEYLNVSYDIAKKSGISTLISILIGLVMYVVVPLYNNGQTIGKKLLKIKVISRVGDLEANQLIFRAFIANSILVDLISVLLILTASRSVYFYCYGMFTLIQYVITVISIFMIMYSKKGYAIHDLIAHTQVVKC